MLESIRSFFRASMMPAENATPAVRDRDLRRAACALLLELAHADDEFSPDERQHLEAAVRRHFGLDKAQADELLHTAERARQKATDLWQFTTLIREHYTLGQKMVLAEIMWGLVYSDGELSTREDQLMRKVSYLLGLEMGYLSEARTRVREGRSRHVDSSSVDEDRRAD
jgi:uncharacterized tellurite resistance protein B-like protein